MPKSLFYRNVILIINRACIKRRLVKKSFEFFWTLAQDKTQVRHDLPPLLSRILYSSLLFVDDLFSVCFLELFVFPSHVALCQIFAFFTYAFSCSLPCSSRRILPIFASFLTFLRIFLDSLYTFSFLLSLVALFFLHELAL